MEVKFHTTFKKKLKKIPSKIQDRFYERLELFVQDKFARALNNHSVDRAYQTAGASMSVAITGLFSRITGNLLSSSTSVPIQIYIERTLLADNSLQPSAQNPKRKKKFENF